MAFSDFKSIAEVQRRYQIKYEEGIFVAPQEAMPSAGFVADFEFNKEHIDIFSSEAARSEIIISPLLREMYKKRSRNYSFWIQKSIVCDEVLTGTARRIISFPKSRRWARRFWRPRW